MINDSVGADGLTLWHGQAAEIHRMQTMIMMTLDIFLSHIGRRHRHRLRLRLDCCSARQWPFVTSKNFR